MQNLLLHMLNLFARQFAVHAAVPVERTHVKRLRTGVQKAKQAAKLQRRYDRWEKGLWYNDCVSSTAYCDLTGLDS